MSWPVPPHGFLGSQVSTAATDNDTYQISKSLRFNSADSAHLSRTPSVASNRKTWTWSGWVKKANSGVAAFICADPNSGNRATSFYTRSLTDGRLEFEHFDGTTTYNLTAADLLRDSSSYYHLVVAVDTTQATNTNRTKIYKNGALLTLSGTYVPQNTDMDINNNVRHNLGRFQSASVGVASYLDGYLAEVNFIDGQALTPSSFGETDATTGRWKAKAYTGTYGTNGFYLPFSNNSGVTATTLGKDNSTYRMLTTGLNGTTNGIQRGADLTGNANGKTGTISMWWDFTGASSGFQVLWSSRHNTTIGTSLNTYRDANGKIGISALNSAGTTILSAVTTTNVAASSGIYHVYMAWDMAVNNQVKIYVNGVDQALTISTFTNDTIQYVVPNHGLGGNLFGPFAPTTPGMVGQVYVNYATYLDPVTNISKFYGGTSTPIGIGTSGEIPSGSSPIVYLDGNATTILTNRGTGGNFAAFGTLATGTTYEGVGSHYNNWTPNNFSVTPGAGNDSLVDSPSNYGTISTTLVNDTYQISRSLRFNKADLAHLTRTPASASNRKTWTWSGWVKRAKVDVSTFYQLFGGGTGSGANDGIFFDVTAGGIYYTTGTTDTLVTSSVYRDPSVWYHIVLASDTTQSTTANRVRIYVNGSEVTSFATANYPALNADNAHINTTSQHRIGAHTNNSALNFDGYLAEINFIDGQALTPTSFGTRDINTYLWKPKAYTGTYGTNGFYLNFSDSSNTTAATLGKDQAGSNDWTPNNFSVSAGPGNDSLVDSPTYYGTDTGVGGEARGDYATMDSTYPGSVLSNGNLRSTASLAISTLFMTSGKYYFEATPATSTVVDTNTYYIGVTGSAFVAYALSGNRFNGTSWVGFGNAFVSGDVIGLAVDVSGGVVSFYKNNVLQGTQAITANGTYRVFSNISGSNTGSAFDFNFGQRPFAYTAPSGFRALRDYNKLPTPTGGEVRGNYCTLNPLAVPYSGTISNGNLEYSKTNTGIPSARGSIYVKTGKWYCEVKLTATSDVIGVTIGIMSPSSTGYVGFSANSYAYRGSGSKFNNDTSTSYGASYSVGDVIGVALDMDAGTLTFYKNGVSQGLAFSSLSGEFTIGAGWYGTAGTAYFEFNFGQRPWAYDAPFGFLPLCTTLLPQPIIQKSSSYMDVVTWTGNGNSSRSITGFGFSPDLIWIKGRSGTPDHALIDTVRGTGAKVLSSNQTDAENDFGLTVTSFDSGGFTVGSGSLNFSYANTNSATYVAWAWDESPIAGMDIVSFTAPASGSTTISHNLGVAPKMIITKNRNAATNWTTYHSSATNKDQYLFLNTTNAVLTLTDVWGTSAPTSSGFGSNSSNQGASANVIAYLFAEVEGFSRFGSYTGNGSADGPFVYCGFRPRWVMVKKSSSTGSWAIVDTARNTSNVANTALYPDLSNEESSSFEGRDYLSNGFKLRTTDQNSNQNSQTYIFAAFAESPFKYARAR